MKVLLYGAGKIGSQVFCQVRKNPDIEVVTVNPRDDDCEAVDRGIIDAVNLGETLTPMNLATIVDRIGPDLVLFASVSEDLGLGHAPGISLLMEALREEIESLPEVPVVDVARRMGSTHR